MRNIYARNALREGPKKGVPEASASLALPLTLPITLILSYLRI